MITLLINAVPAWAEMWLLVAAAFLICKGMTLRRSGTASAGGIARVCAYLFLWPGMNADDFLFGRLQSRATHRSQIVMAAANVGVGAMLLWTIVRRTIATPTVAAWIGMTGIVLVLHFGIFKLFAIAWQSRGVNAEPIMRNPIAAYSLGDFWRRWNTAFRDLADAFIYRPLVRRMNPIIATTAAFTASGVVHDLVISVPARAGFGRPTLYFLIQAVGVIVTHSTAGRKAGLQRGLPGWAFTVVTLVAPLGLLFHPPFIHRVALPFLRAIGCY